jgi:hypothetical protein
MARGTMEKVVNISRSFTECDRSDKEFYRGLTPLQRLEILLELNSRWPQPDHAEAAQRPARFYRVIKRS